ncbi:MAG: MFS transporter [Bryobacteraceae bacterium]|nr:MFS transporter [Bryobacteraceae bacterium]
MSNIRWYIAALLFFASVINYIDRQALSVVAPVLTKELNISPIEYANILQAFLVAYTVMYVFSGVLCDRFGTRVSLAVFMVWWSISNAIHAFAQTPLHLGIFRFLLGAGESGNFMASIKAVSEWYPAKEKAFANGLINAGAAVGAIVAAPLVVWINSQYGWRAAFVITGSMGFVWLIFWLWLYYLPERHPMVNRQELEHIRHDSPAPKPLTGTLWSRWRGLLRYRQTWGLLLARVISDPVWWFYLFWLPKYLVDQRGFSMQQMGMLSWLPYLFADVGSVVGGVGSGWLLHKLAWQPLRSRSAVMLASAALMPLSALIGFTPSNTIALSIICLVTCAHMAWKTNLMTMTNDVYPANIVGSVAGIVAFGSGVGATLFTALTGWLVQHFSYSAVFVIMGFLHPLSWLVVRALVRGPIAVEPEQPHLGGSNLMVDSAAKRL